MKRFLIVKTSAIGDILQCFPLLSYLKKRFPKCEIDWVVEKRFSPLLKAHPLVHCVIELDTKKWRTCFWKSLPEVRASCKVLRVQTYDVVFDLQGNAKSGVITTFAKAIKKVGYSWNCLPERVNFFATNVHLFIKEQNIRLQYLKLLLNFFGDEDGLQNQEVILHLNDKEQQELEALQIHCTARSYLMVCFASNWENKMLSKKTLIEFLQLIQAQFSLSFFFIYNGQKEEEMAFELQNAFPHSMAIGGLSLPLWQRFMGIVEGVIAMDSAALHLCATTSTPSFSIFGPSSSLVYKPLRKVDYAFQASCPYGLNFSKRCEKLRSCKTGNCLKALFAKELFTHFERFWQKLFISTPL